MELPPAPRFPELRFAPWERIVDVATLGFYSHWKHTRLTDGYYRERREWEAQIRRQMDVERRKIEAQIHI
jgi:hypothetical protein